MLQHVGSIPISDTVGDKAEEIVKGDKMKVELSIADDRELRKHIKDTIKGEVTSILRGEIKSLIAEAFEEEFGKKVLDKFSIDQMVKNMLEGFIKKHLKITRYNDKGHLESMAKTVLYQAVLDSGIFPKKEEVE